MRSTDELVQEHRIILSVLLGLEQRIAAAAQRQAVPVAFLRSLIAFSRDFVDRCHHAKEEGCLFPCLERRGMPREGGLLAVMLEEHAAGRALVARITDALDRYERGEGSAAAVLDPCRAYADLLRGHIVKEDDVLFPLGDGMMTAEDHRAAGGCFLDREAALGAGAAGRLEQLAARLGGSAPDAGGVEG